MRTGDASLADLNQLELDIARHHDHRHAHMQAMHRARAMLLAAVGAPFGQAPLDASIEPITGLPQTPAAELREQAQQSYDPDAVPLLILLDDSDTKKLSKAELKEKLTGIFNEHAQEVDERLQPEVLLLSEMWELCKDGKYEVLQDIAMSTPVYDVGMLDAIKLVEVHKQMVLKKFEKYIVAYVLGGSLVQGTATTKSDVDVFIVIDDTDVKKMTRAELRDKLRAIIIDLGQQAGEMTGVQNKINIQVYIQVYILTDFWDNIKEANPVIFTFLRDGVPFYDRGIFMPWKQLLEMGKVKPSQEAIDQFMTYGDQYLKRVKLKLREIGVDDFFWATVTPSQAAIMLDGHMLEQEHVDNLEHILKVRKAIEHGDKTEISGAEIDELYGKAEQYVERLNDLFEKIQEQKDRENVLHTYENAVTLVRDVLASHGHDVKDAKLIQTFEEELVKAGHVPQKFVRILHDIKEAKQAYDQDELSRTEAQDVHQKGREFFRYLLDYLQRQRSGEVDRAKIREDHEVVLEPITERSCCCPRRRTSRTTSARSRRSTRKRRAPRTASGRSTRRASRNSSTQSRTPRSCRPRA